MDATTIAQRYIEAFGRGDLPLARQYLVDDLSFSGPAASFQSADEYVAASAHAAGVLKGIKTHKVFQDGADVCVFYELQIDHPIGSLQSADWYHIEDDRIASIRTIFDTGPFVAPAAGQTDAAVDPVCHMTVQKASATAQRTHDGATYYFCSPACAAAFEAEPRRYLAPAN